MPPDSNSAGEAAQAEEPSNVQRPVPIRSGPRRGGLRTFSSLQNNPNYRYLFAGNLFANAAQWLQFISIGWLALDISGSAFHSIMAVACSEFSTPRIFGLTLTVLSSKKFLQQTMFAQSVRV